MVYIHFALCIYFIYIDRTHDSNIYHSHNTTWRYESDALLKNVNRSENREIKNHLQVMRERTFNVKGEQCSLYERL